MLTERVFRRRELSKTLTTTLSEAVAAILLLQGVASLDGCHATPLSKPGSVVSRRPPASRRRRLWSGIAQE